MVEETVSDSQCEFRAGRGCVEMIFCAHQLVEKATEHNTKVCFCLLTYARPTTLYPE